MQHEINNVHLTLTDVQKDFEELKRKFLDQFSRLLALFISSDGSLNRFMSSHIAIINGESFIQYPDAQLFASTKYQGEYAAIDETTHTVTRRIDIKRNIDICFDYRKTENNKKIQLPNRYETGAQLLNELLADSKYDYYQDYFKFDTDIDTISEIQQLYNTVATIQQFPNNYDNTIMFTYFNIILNLLQLKLLEKTNALSNDDDTVDDNTDKNTEIFTGNTHDVYITGSTNIYLRPGEYQNISITNSSSINLCSSYNLTIVNSSFINIDKILQHLIIVNCKNIYSISPNNIYNSATHNTLSNIEFATQIDVSGNYTLKYCKFITAIIASKNINIDTTDIIYCNNCTNLTIYNCSTFNCTNLNNLSQKFMSQPNIFYNAQTTVNLQANSQLQTLWQGVSLNVDKINIIYPTTSCQNISINATKQSQETNTKEINIVGENIWGYDISHQWSIIGSLQDANKKTYAVYNNNGYLTTIPINAEFNNYTITLNVEDNNIPGDSIKYQLINIYLPNDFPVEEDSTIIILVNSSKQSNFSVNKLQINNIRKNIELQPNIMYHNEETQQTLYYEINILTLYGVEKADGTEPQITISYIRDDEIVNITQTFYQYFNELYFYDCNIKILEEQVQFIQKLQNIQFVVDNLRSYDFTHENIFGGLFTNFKLNSISNPYVTEIPNYTFYNCEFTGTDLQFPAVQIIGESAFETSQQFSQQKQYNFKFTKLIEIKNRAFKGRQIRTLSRDESATMFVGNNAFIDTQIENINFINTTYSAQSTNIFNSPTLNILIDSAKFTQNIFRGTKNLNIYPIDYWFPHTYIQFPSSANIITNLNIINTIYGNILAPTQIITTGVQSYVGNVDINDIFLGNNEETLITLSTTENINIAAQTPINIPFIYANNMTQIMLMDKVQGIYLNKAILGADLNINSHHFFCKDLSYNGHTVSFIITTPLINFNVSLYSHQTPSAVQKNISFINAVYVVVDDITVINNLSSISSRGTQDITIFCHQADEAAINSQHQYITTGKLTFVII